VRTELFLIVLTVATLVLAASRRRPPRLATQRRPVEQSDIRRRRIDEDTPDAKRGVALRTAFAGLGTATVGVLGHLAAPQADVLWLALIAVGIASVPIAFAAERLQGSWVRNRRR
jgi:hypothetical protein